MLTPISPIRRPWFLLATTAAMLLCAAPPADFTVESPVDGSRFHLADAKGRYVVLHFLLKTECPYCLRYTRDFAKRGAALKDVQQVFLKPDTADEIRAWSGKLGDEAPALPIYRDADAALAAAYDVPDGYRFHGQVVHYPALILLDPTGREVFRYVGKDNSDRLSFDKLEAKVSELKSAAGAAPKSKP